MKESNVGIILQKKLSTLLGGITSKQHGDLYFLNCIHWTENKIKSHEMVCKYKDFYGFVMPSVKDNVLEFNQYMKSDKMPYIFHADMESSIEKNRWMCK